MEKFTKISGRAAALPLVNVDTDMIIPKQFLKTIKRTGLGANLFDEMRFTENGEEIADFVLNKPAFCDAEILISGENFGCGSSREHAPWAIVDFGIKCIIAPSFADIFYNNCFKNGILPIVLPQEQVDELVEYASIEDNNIAINLEKQEISFSGKGISFDVDSFRKHCLLNGLDDISLTFEKSDKIDLFEAKQRESQPWLYKKAV